MFCAVALQQDFGELSRAAEGNYQVKACIP
jgi:hypothetical protein